MLVADHLLHLGLLDVVLESLVVSGDLPLQLDHVVLHGRQEALHCLSVLVQHCLALFLESRLLLLPVGHVRLDLDQRQVSDGVHRRDELAILLREHWLGEDVVLCQLLPLPLIGVEPHLRLPLLEEPHRLELLKERNLFEDLIDYAVVNVLLIRDEIGDAVLVLGDTHETVLAEDDDAGVILWWVLILLEHQVGVRVFHLLERQENLSSLLNLPQQVRDLLGGLRLLLGHLPVPEERNLGRLGLCSSRYRSLLVKLALGWSGSHHGLSVLVASGASGQLGAPSGEGLVVIVLGRQCAGGIVRVVWLLEVVVEYRLGDELRLIAPVLVELRGPIVPERIQGCGVLVQGVLVRALVEERLESRILLSSLDASDHLADVILESGRLAAGMRR